MSRRHERRLFALERRDHGPRPPAPSPLDVSALTIAEQDMILAADDLIRTKPQSKWTPADHDLIARTESLLSLLRSQREEKS